MPGVAFQMVDTDGLFVGVDEYGLVTIIVDDTMVCSNPDGSITAEISREDGVQDLIRISDGGISPVRHYPPVTHGVSVLGGRRREGSIKRRQFRDKEEDQT